MNTRGNISVLFRILLVVLSLTTASRVLAQTGYDGPYPNQPGYGNDPYGNDQYGGYDIDRPIDSFYDELSPYGQWVQTPEYGRVWIPQVEQGFQPYASNGRWVVTEYGNTWVSDYAWGWAPFHYGRWYLDNYRGWVWVPGREWAPAWVCWRSGGGYYGWAPLSPGINISVNVNIPYNYWVFVPQLYITSPRVYNYCLPRNRAVTIINNTTIINNVHRYNNRSYYYGPNRRDLEYATRRSVPVYRTNDVYRSGGYASRDRNTGRGSYNANPGNDGRNNYPGDYSSRGQSNRTGTYRGPATEAPGNRNYPGQNNGNRYESPSPNTNNVPSQPQGGFPDNTGRGRGSYQPQAPGSVESPMPRPNTESGWSRENRNNDSRNGGYRQPSADPSSANTGGYGGVAPRSGSQPERRYEAPSQPSNPAPQSSSPQGRSAGGQESRGQYQPRESRGGGQEQGQRSAPAPDLGGGQGGGNGRRGPR